MKNLILLLSALLILNNSTAQKRGIINNVNSPYVKLKSIDIGDCKWTEGFWADKFKVCEEAMIPYMGEVLCGEVGHALNNFKIAAGMKEGKHQGMKWHDGDFYKWLEAAMYVYAQNGDIITIKMPMETNLVEGHPRIEEVRNQVAIQRGPVVYCIESPDLPENTKITDIYIDGSAPLTPAYNSSLLGGIVAIKSDVLLRADEGDGMYRTVKKPRWTSFETQFVPYYAWSNRGKAEMTVFMPIVWNH